MKQTISYLFLLAALVFQGCSDDDPSLGAIIAEEDVNWSYSQTETVGEFLFVNETPGVTTLWDFGNGQKLAGATAVAQYGIAGTYPVTIKVLSQGGELNIVTDLLVEEGNPAFLEGEVFDYLAGGRSNPDGKIWKVDQFYKGHMGCGPTAEDATGWWAANANDKAGLGLYDDEYKFIMTDTGLALEQYTNGDVFAQAGTGSQLGTDNTEDGPVPFDDAIAACSVSGDNNELLSLTGDAFIGFFLGYPANYTITKLNENELEIVYAGDGIFWFQRLVTVDNLTPEPATEPLPLMSITALTERFNSTSELFWIPDGDGVTMTIAPDTLSMESPVADDVEVSDSCAYFTRGGNAGAVYANTYFDLDGSIDFTNGVKVMLDVYVPSTNDYTTGAVAGDWITVPTEEDAFKTLEVKLQNREKGGDSWQTQMTIKTDVLKDYEDQWVTLVFDFDEVYEANTDNADKDLMNRVILQYGGEGWDYVNNIGVFYDNVLGMDGNSPIVPVNVASTLYIK